MKDLRTNVSNEGALDIRAEEGCLSVHHHLTNLFHHWNKQPWRSFYEAFLADGYCTFELEGNKGKIITLGGKVTFIIVNGADVCEITIPNIDMRKSMESLNGMMRQYYEMREKSDS